MESSEITNQEIINLGKAIITELGMEIDCNTPARWLVHYIAENIHKSENCQGEEKEVAERKCVDAIFKLWHHRSELPRGINPFTEFDSVFRGLSRLDNSAQKPYYNEFSQFNHEIDNDESPETKQWVDIAIYIDKAVKILVSESFEIAANAALSEKSKKVLSLAPKDSGNDIQIMFDLIMSEDSSKLGSEKVKKIKEKIHSIEALKTICNTFTEKLNEELSHNYVK
jgi:hypothetical protein